MSNRVVCREASHAGSWYTASGRAPGRPARPQPPPPGPTPGSRRSAALPRAAAGGTRARTAAGRGPRGEGAGRRPASPPPPPGRHPAGQPRAGRPHAHPRVGREGQLPPQAACAVPWDLARGRNVLPVLLDPSLLVASSGCRDAGGRALPPPGGRFARRPSPAFPTRSWATLRPLAHGGTRSPPLARGPRPREFSECLRAHPILLAVCWKEVFFFPLAV